MSRKLVVYVNRQEAELIEDEKVLKTYTISTAANGISCEAGSNCTPSGVLRVAKKIGAGLPQGTVFRARVPVSEDWSANSQEDLVLSRILWLEGTEEKNANTLGRYVYLHGTNQEHLLGTPASHGCIRFGVSEICEVFDELFEGDLVEIRAPFEAL